MTSVVAPPEARVNYSFRTFTVRVDAAMSRPPWGGSDAVAAGAGHLLNQRLENEAAPQKIRSPRHAPVVLRSTSHIIGRSAHEELPVVPRLRPRDPASGVAGLQLSSTVRPGMTR